jgi:hypothetical protein
MDMAQPLSEGGIRPVILPSWWSLIQWELDERDLLPIQSELDERDLLPIQSEGVTRDSAMPKATLLYTDVKQRMSKLT